MSYKLGKRSLSTLEGVHPDLVKVVKRAIELTECDFSVIEGLRTKQRQAQLLKEKKTTTMNSRHLTGHAVDLAAWVDGTISWDWKYYEQIEAAMKQAASELKIPVEWGGVWDREISQYESAEEASKDYVKRRKAKGQSVFLDAPHFQLAWSKYGKTDL